MRSCPFGVRASDSGNHRRRRLAPTGCPHRRRTCPRKDRPAGQCRGAATEGSRDWLREHRFALVEAVSARAARSEEWARARPAELPYRARRPTKTERDRRRPGVRETVDGNRRHWRVRRPRPTAVSWRECRHTVRTRHAVRGRLDPTRRFARPYCCRTALGVGPPTGHRSIQRFDRLRRRRYQSVGAGESTNSRSS